MAAPVDPTATAAQLAEQRHEIALLRALVKAHEAKDAAALYSAKMDLLEWDDRDR